MNAEETSRILVMINTHYWRTANLAERNIDLMIETWTKALADIPLTPYIENALDWWFKNEKWPPQAAELRERAKGTMRNEQEAQRSAELLAGYRRLPEQAPTPALAPIGIRRRVIARLSAGEITADEVDGEIARLVAESEEPRLKAVGS